MVTSSGGSWGRVGPGGRWPIAFEVTLAAPGNSAGRSAFEELQEELENIDGAYFHEAVPRAEWEAVAEEVVRVCVEEHRDHVRGALACLCWGLVENPADAAARRLRDGKMQKINTPARGKFNRKVDWTALARKDGRAIEVHILPRKGYAKWVEEDKAKQRAASDETATERAVGIGMAAGRLGLGIAKGKFRRARSRLKASLGVDQRPAPRAANLARAKSKLLRSKSKPARGPDAPQGQLVPEATR